MKLENARIEFSRLQKRISAINHATELMFFDGETIAPPDTIDNRIRTLDVLNDEKHKLKYGEDTVRLADYLKENEDVLTIFEKRSLELLLRDIDRKRLIPKDKYVKYESLIASAEDAWHKANEGEDYEIFRPYLEQIIDKTIEFAGYCNSSITPYNYCLYNFEYGIDIQVYDRIFDAIRAEIPPLLKRIIEKPQVDDSCLYGDFSVDKQTELAVYIMGLLQLNPERVGLATAEHPFSTYLGSHFDERIVTRFSRKDFTFSLYTMLFQSGHVLCTMGQEDNVAYTFVDNAESLGIFESQCRFYENVIGRSRTFIEYIYPELVELFPDPLEKYSAEDVFLAVNKVAPGPIRMGSDEVTNNLHILVRYEIEKALMDKSLSVKDLPEAWAEKYKKYLNVEVDSPVRGVLQDIHWASGAIGYFPMAVLGNTYLASIVEKMKEDLDLDACIGQGNFKLINLWNREHVWRRAGLYDTQMVMNKYVGTDINAEPYIRYIKDKYSKVYGL